MKKQTPHHPALPYLLGGVALGAFALALPSLLAWNFLHPPRRPHRKTPKTALGLDYERFILRSEDGVRLSAWYIPVNEPKGVVVLAHGYHGNRYTMLPYVKFLNAAGYSTLVFDFRAHGWSGGSMTSFGVHEPQDLRTALKWAFDEPRHAGLPIALLGESMGASVVLLVAAEEPRVGAIVADSAYARFDNAVAGRLQTVFGSKFGGVIIPPTQRIGERILGTRCEAIAPVLSLPKIAPRPVFLIHGLKDTLIAPGNTNLLHQSSPDNTTVWYIPGAAHVMSVYVAGEEYGKRVVKFLDESLGIEREAT